MLEEYGSVSLRTVQRALSRLRKRGAIIAIRDRPRQFWGYKLPPLRSVAR